MQIVMPSLETQLTYRSLSVDLILELRWKETFIIYDYCTYIIITSIPVYFFYPWGKGHLRHSTNKHSYLITIHFLLYRRL
jgi:hypothetical protein